MKQLILRVVAVACFVTVPFAAQAEKPAASASAPVTKAVEQAPGGGPGKVWANSGSKVYHCPGDRHYGTTKKGEYLTEAEAKSRGLHASRNKACAS